VRACAAYYLHLPGRRRAGAPEAPATGFGADYMSSAVSASHYSGWDHRCLHVAAATCFCAGWCARGGFDSALHASANSFFHMQRLHASPVPISGGPCLATRLRVMHCTSCIISKSVGSRTVGWQPHCYVQPVCQSATRFSESQSLGTINDCMIVPPVPDDSPCYAEQHARSKTGDCPNVIELKT
jgi:hypothetical protein